MTLFKILPLYCLLVVFEGIAGCRKQAKHPASAPFAPAQADSLVRGSAPESFSHFLDRIIKPKVPVLNQASHNIVFSEDSFGYEKRYVPDIFDSKKAVMEISRSFSHPQKEIAPNYLDCISYFGYSDKVFKKFPIHCLDRFDYSNQNWVKFGKCDFFFLKTEFDDDCMGKGCLGSVYPIFAIRASNQIDMYCFYNYVDIAGLRFGDIDGDGYLDFLEIGGEYTDEEFEIMSKSGLESGHFFKIKAVTYKNNRWTRFKDEKGNDLFIFVQLKEALDLRSAFTVLRSNWPFAL